VRHTRSFMSTTVVVLLGLMAVASLTQAVFLVMLALESRRLAQRVDAFQLRIGTELRPILGEMTRATENLAAASAETLGQARRIDVMMTDVTEQLSDTEGLFRNIVMPTASRLISLTAAVRAVRTGLALYRRVRG
jgi:predicted PurR-regulated permease PerM